MNLILGVTVYTLTACLVYLLESLSDEVEDGYEHWRAILFPFPVFLSVIVCAHIAFLTLMFRWTLYRADKAFDRFIRTFQTINKQGESK